MRPNRTVAPLAKNVAQGTVKAPLEVSPGWRCRSVFGVDPGDGDRAGGVDQAGSVSNNLVRQFARGLGAIACLESDRVDDLGDAVEHLFADRKSGTGAAVADLLDRVALTEVDCGGSELAGLVQAGIDAVDAVNLARPPEQGRVRGEQSYGAAPNTATVSPAATSASVVACQPVTNALASAQGTRSRSAWAPR